MNLKTLSVQQNRTIYEKIAPQDLEYLYDTIINNQLDSSSKLVGNVETDYGYLSHCQFIKNKYKLWNYSIKDTYYEWEDLQFQRAISKLHGDGTGIRPADLIKTITLTSVAAYGNTSQPFYRNKNIRTIDMRPFENFRYTLTRNTSSNLCVVKADDDEDEYALKEIYYSSTLGNGFSAASFIEQGTRYSPIYYLDKVWYEGPNSQIYSEGIYDGGGHEKRYGIRHFYWLNHNEGLGSSWRKSITDSSTGTDYYYIQAPGNSGGWNSRGTFFENIILDSPIPIFFGSHTWGNGMWGQTKLWVPDNQLESYNYIYYSLMPNEMPASISTMTVYNNVYRSMANWWVYPDKITYQSSY